MTDAEYRRITGDHYRGFEQAVSECLLAEIDRLRAVNAELVAEVDRLRAVEARMARALGDAWGDVARLRMPDQ